MDFFYWLGLLVFLYYVFYIVTTIVCDSDVGMILAQWFGKPTDELRGKVIWITGASSGIGEHLAMSCAKVGSKLILSARRVDELERVKNACIEISKGKLAESDVMILTMDVLDFKSHQGLFDKAIEKFGVLDILVNNAGRSQRAIWEDIEIDVDRSIFDLNVFGVINLTRICIRYFTQKGEGHVAVTSSGAGIIGAPFSASYTGTKHAIHGYFNSLRAEKFGSKITVTIYCPGPTFTNFLAESYTSKKEDKFGQTTRPTDKRMTGERCGHLFAVALVNKIDEAWVSVRPLIALYYMNCYYQNILKRILKLMGPRFLLKLRDSRESMKTQ